jgi:hypothetical protein
VASLVSLASLVMVKLEAMFWIVCAARCAGGIGPVGLAGFWASPSRM